MSAYLEYSKFAGGSRGKHVFASVYLLSLSQIGGVAFLSKYMCGKQYIVTCPIRDVTNCKQEYTP